MSRSPKFFNDDTRKKGSFRVPSFRDFFKRDSDRNLQSTARSSEGSPRLEDADSTLANTFSSSINLEGLDETFLTTRPPLELDASRFKLLDMLPVAHEGFLWRKGGMASMWRSEPDYFLIKGTVLLQFRQKSKLRLFGAGVGGGGGGAPFSLHRTVDLKNCAVEDLAFRGHFAFKVAFVLGGSAKELVLDARSVADRAGWCAAARAAAFSLTVGDFTPLAKVGEGEWGNVFVAGKRAALRQADPKLYAVKEIEMSRSSNVKHIIHERNVLGAVSLHPFVIGLHACFRHGRYLYFCMDFAAGGDLFTRMKKAKPTRSEAVLYAAEVLLALEHLHQNRVVYRDLKPENVLLDADGHVQLADMGLAKILRAEGERTLTFCGTESYIAPEIIRRRPYAFSVDLWQFGCFVFELYCGRSPFWRPRHLRQNLHETICSGVYKTPSSVAAEARPLIAALLHVDPPQRQGGGPDGWAPVKADAYFRNIDFASLLANAALPAREEAAGVTQGGLGRYMGNFDDCFTSAAPAFKGAAKSPSAAAQALFQDELLGFDLFEMSVYRRPGAAAAAAGAASAAASPRPSGGGGAGGARRGSGGGGGLRRWASRRASQEGTSAARGQQGGSPPQQQQLNGRRAPEA